jgi:hypothetical protein
MRVLYRVFLVVLVMAGLVAPDLLAQPPVGGPPPCWPPPCIPIDGGLGLLIGAGTLLGGKKAMDLRLERKSAQH